VAAIQTLRKVTETGTPPLGIKHAQHRVRHESKEADVSLHSRPQNGAAQVRMLLRGIANQKQFQSLVERVIPQVRLGHGEGLDQPGQIFLRLDIPA